MARDFDGVNDNINFGSDASIDAFTLKSLSYWIRPDATSAPIPLCKDSEANGWITLIKGADTKFRFSHLWTTIGRWDTGNTIAAGTLRHVVVSYDGSSASNDPVIYFDGVAETLTRANTPTGTIGSDAAVSLIMGENGSGAQDFDGQILAFCYDNAAWSAAQANRSRYWGDPGGAVKVKHPFFTSKLANEGSATADGTATGSVMATATIPRVERRWGSMMGVGR